MNINGIGVYNAMVASSNKLKRGIVWCTTCGRSQRVDSALHLQIGWPRCCGYTMTIDSPAEREQFYIIRRLAENGIDMDEL